MMDDIIMEPAIGVGSGIIGSGSGGGGGGGSSSNNPSLSGTVTVQQPQSQQQISSQSIHLIPMIAEEIQIDSSASGSSGSIGVGGGSSSSSGGGGGGSSGGSSGNVGGSTSGASGNVISDLEFSGISSGTSGGNVSTTSIITQHQQQNHHQVSGSGSGIGGPTTGSSAALMMQSDDEPDIKRKKLDEKANVGVGTSKRNEIQEKLESRLGGILSCSVCLDLPKTAMYQCQMGHLMCAACFAHLLADGRLRDQVATCPNCRVEISKSTASRNLAVEKAVSELPSECQYCGKEYASKSLKHHENSECEERPINCKYSRIGCQWKGPVHEASDHELNCLHPKKCGADVMLALQSADAVKSEEMKLFNTLIELLSYERIIFNDLQLKPYRTDEYVHKLFYETSRFPAFGHQWIVKARINNSQRDPHTVTERQITYQLILKSKTTTALPIHFFALKGPFSDIKINTQIYKHEFTDQENESEFYLLPLLDSSECNRLLAAKAINLRLIMFLLPK